MALPDPLLSAGIGTRSQQRIWEAALLECGVLFGLAFILQNFSPFLPEALRTLLNLLLALVPALLWLGNSWWRGGYRLPIRSAAFGCLLVTGLVGNALCLPLIEHVYEVQRWLPLESAINRIIGYSFTVGLAQALSLWLVVRYAVPRRDLEVRLDLLVCCRAAAVGYAVVAGLDNALEVHPTLSAQAFTVFNTTVALNCVAIIIAYALAELYFRRNLHLLLPMSITAFAAFVSGSAIPLVAGLSNAEINSLQPVARTSPLLGSLYSLGMLLATWFVFRFLFANAGSGTSVVVRDNGFS